MSSVVLFHGSAIACWEEAGAQYGVNPSILYAIAKTESSLNPRAINLNANGSYDIGVMQINSSWLPTLRRYGITESHLWEPCTNIKIGAWIYASNIVRLGNTWDAVGAYNAKTPSKRSPYAWKIYQVLYGLQKKKEG